MLIGKNKLKMYKKALCLIFAFLFSIESFAAVVSDNDGSAFITKAEFDSLKNDFQSRIDNYNTSIDNKIDSAVSSYLAGIKTSATEAISNISGEFETETAQKIFDLKWTKATDFCLNEGISASADSQKIYQEIYWNQFNHQNDNKAGQQTMVGPADAADGENRIEVGTGNDIIAWGNFAPKVTINSMPVVYGAGQQPDFWTWAPTSTDFFKPLMRKLRGVTQWNSGNNTTNKYTELQYGKYDEINPSDLNTLNMNMLQIAPLSTKNEGTLPPAPGVNDADFTCVNISTTTYGENIFACNTSRQYISSGAPTGYTLTTVISEGAANMPSQGGAYYADLTARWFRVRKYNNLSFNKIDKKMGFTCPMKCGLPISNEITCKANDEIKIKLSSATVNGYFIPYAANSPDDTWGGNKNNYNTGNTFKVSAGVEKTFTIKLTEAGDYYVFVVWLPDSAAKLPNVEIIHNIFN